MPQLFLHSYVLLHTYQFCMSQKNSYLFNIARFTSMTNDLIWRCSDKCFMLGDVVTNYLMFGNLFMRPIIENKQACMESL